MHKKILTKDAYKFLCLIYKEYLKRRKSMPKDSANFFDLYSDNIFKKIHHSDVNSYISELERNGFVRAYQNAEFRLIDNGIVYMENRFNRIFSKLADILFLLKP